MKDRIVPFKEEYTESAVKLFIENYKKARAKNALLPNRVIDEPEWIINTLKSRVHNPGVAVFQQSTLVAYMVTGFQFMFKGQETVLIPEYCHSSIKENKTYIYHQMYMELARLWIKDKIHLHIISHLSEDIVLKETLYQIGFGAILKEQLRDFSSITRMPKIKIIKEKNIENLISLEIEHKKYYTESPIFIIKNTDKKNVIADLKKHSANGDIFLVYYENEKPCAYFILGESGENGEGFLLQKTNTAQIKGAFAVPDCRGKGIGKALLQYAVDWSKEKGYERLFVEHETANFYGGNFWNKHFIPYLLVSMRYIDTTI